MFFKSVLLVVSTLFRVFFATIYTNMQLFYLWFWRWKHIIMYIIIYTFLFMCNYRVYKFYPGYKTWLGLWPALFDILMYTL